MILLPTLLSLETTLNPVVLFVLGEGVPVKKVIHKSGFGFFSFFNLSIKFPKATIDYLSDLIYLSDLLPSVIPKAHTC